VLPLVLARLLAAIAAIQTLVHVPAQASPNDPVFDVEGRGN